MRNSLSKTPLLLLAVFSSDLHKYTINIISVLIGKNLEFTKVATFADIIIGASLLLLIAYELKRTKFKIFTKGKSVVIINVLIVVLYLFALLRNYNSTSLDFFLKFIAGNIGLFYAVVLFCKDEDDIEYIMRIWVITSLIISIVSILFFINGINYTSGRAKIIPGITFRVGYMASISIIYKIINYRINLSKSRVYLEILEFTILIFGVVTSGSKASLILLLLILVVYFLKYKNNSTYDFKTIFFSSVIFISILLIVYFTAAGKYGKDLFNIDSYLVSLNGRMDLFKDYISYGLKSPIFGSSISDSYTVGDNRTHSILTSIFVQVGLVGLILYIVFIIKTISIGIFNINHGNKLARAILLIFLYAIFFSEIASDIPGNRFLWMFSAMYIVLADSDPDSKLITNEER